MAITLGDNFSYQGAKPLDGRLKYDTVAAMASMADSVLYDGCLALVVSGFAATISLHKTSRRVVVKCFRKLEPKIAFEFFERRIWL